MTSKSMSSLSLDSKYDATQVAHRVSPKMGVQTSSSLSSVEYPTNQQNLEVRGRLVPIISQPVSSSLSSSQSTSLHMDEKSQIPSSRNSPSHLIGRPVNTAVSIGTPNVGISPNQRRGLSPQTPRLGNSDPLGRRSEQRSLALSLWQNIVIRLNFLFFRLAEFLATIETDIIERWRDPTLPGYDSRRSPSMYEKLSKRIRRFKIISSLNPELTSHSGFIPMVLFCILLILFFMILFFFILWVFQSKSQKGEHCSLFYAKCIVVYFVFF